jgi:hypothetical protein
LRSKDALPGEEIKMHKEGNRTVESAVEARGDLLGRPVLLVLVVMALSYAGFFGTA